MWNISFHQKSHKIAKIVRLLNEMFSPQQKSNHIHIIIIIQVFNDHLRAQTAKRYYIFWNGNSTWISGFKKA